MVVQAKFSVVSGRFEGKYSWKIKTLKKIPSKEHFLHPERYKNMLLLTSV